MIPVFGSSPEAYVAKDRNHAHPKKDGHSLQGMLSVLSRHFWNSLTYSAGNNVGLLATNWPT